LLGSAESVFDEAGVELDPLAVEIAASLAVGLGDRSLHKLRMEGRALSLDQAVEYALASID
jgi:hypothetical protein